MYPPSDIRLQQLWTNGVDEKWMDVEITYEGEEDRKEDKGNK